MSKRKKGKERQVVPEPEPEPGSDEDEARPAKRLKASDARNRSGKNQHATVHESIELSISKQLLICILAPLEEIADRLRDYHTNNPTFKYKDYIVALMQDHGIKIGRSKVAAYLTQLGLSTSSRGNHIPEAEQTQIVLDELAKDPPQSRGPRVVKEVLNLAGHKIGRNTISAVMHDFQEDGFDKRNPKKGKKIVRTPLTSVGPHEEWSMDGHDKLNVAGFGVYEIRDKWGTKFLYYLALTRFTRPIVAPIRPRGRPARPFVVPILTPPKLLCHCRMRSRSEIQGR
ncbi:hypothetical protein K438DRAFT_1877718 [Mycena galopus ATCC 62051]|nr:hypothetical protein K438DRAFT_1877718 [Mycena galopus ATCC 62051]